MRVDRKHAERWIYSLEGPDGVVRYVGVTGDPERRLHQHRVSSPTSAFTKWLHSMKTRGCIVTMRIVEALGVCERTIAMRREREWTERIRAMGAPLFNAKPRDTGPAWVVVRQQPAILAARRVPARRASRERARKGAA